MSVPLGLSAGPTVAAAWSLLGIAVATGSSQYSPAALVALLCGLALVMAACGKRPRTSGSEPVGGSTTLVLLGATLGGSLVWPVGVYDHGALMQTARALVVAAALLSLATLAERRRVRDGAWGGVLLLSGAAGVLVVVASPSPHIDVWVLLTQAAQGLPGGMDLYGACWRGNPDPLTDCVYPYLPYTTVLQVPFQLLAGDVRYASLAAILAASVLVRRIAGPQVGPTLAAVLVLAPKWLVLVESAWTEALLLVVLCTFVWSVLEARHGIAVVALALALVVKQDMLVLAPLAAWWTAFGLRRTLTAGFLAGAALLPFVVVNPAGFVHDAYVFHASLPPRPESLSAYTALAEAGVRLPVAGVLLATLAGLVVALRAPRDGRGFTIGSALVLLSYTLATKASFYNHYWLIISLLVVHLAVLSRSERVPAGGRECEQPQRTAQPERTPEGEALKRG